MRTRISAVLVALMAASSLGVAGWWIARNRLGRGLPDGFVAASGRLEAREARLSAPVGGRIVALPVREGEVVREGDPIASLDPRPAQAAVEAARADAAAAQAAVEAARRQVREVESQLDLARKERSRARQLLAKQAATQRSVDEAEATVVRLQEAAQAARASLLVATRRAEAAEAQVSAAQVQLDYATIEAPHAGVVDTVLARHGEVVAPGAPIATLLAIASMKLRLYLPLEDAERVQRGDEARVYLDAFPGRVFEGAVEWIAHEAEFTPKDVHMPDERSSLVFAVELRVPNPDGVLKDGFPADAYIRWGRTAPWPEKPPW